MTEKAIQNIYNKLLMWEGGKASQPYPIHKRLKTEAFGFNDIYEWITETYSLSNEAKILDAGCGVGFGSQHLAKHYTCAVKGISLSDQEIKKARVFAKDANVDNVTFEQQSYDNLEPNSFDFILAIESVKHTLDISNTINSLKSALRPNGTLIIIDDFLTDDRHQSLIHKYAKDWALKVILKEDDFIPDFKLKKDLTSFVNTKGALKLSVSIVILSLLKPIKKVAPIMRGGLYLEQLFKKGVMTYYVLEYKKR